MKVLVILAACVAAASCMNCSIPQSDEKTTLDGIRELKHLLELKKQEVFEKDFISEKKGTIEYFYPKGDVSDIKDAMEICQFFGGYLSQILDFDQLMFVKDFIMKQEEECRIFKELRISGLYNLIKGKYYYHNTLDFDLMEMETFLLPEKDFLYPQTEEEKLCLSITLDTFLHRNVFCEKVEEPMTRFLCEKVIHM